MTTTVTCRSFYCKVKTRQQQRNSTNQTTPLWERWRWIILVLTAWLQRGYEISTMLKSFWTLDGKLPAQAQQFASMTWRRSRKSSKVSNMFQSCKCAILPAALWASVMSTAVDSVSVSITSRPRRLGGNEDFVLPLISCHILHFLLLSAAHEIMKLSARKTIKISLMVNMKFVFVWQHQLLHQVRSQRQQRAVCVCGSLRLYSRVLSTEAHWLLGGPGHFPLGCSALLELWGRINVIKAGL